MAQDVSGPPEIGAEGGAEGGSGAGGKGGAAKLGNGMDGVSPSALDVPVPSVLIISVDTLRVDRLQTYGYQRPTSGEILRFSRESVVFDQARTQAPQTAPSHATLFCSEYPGVHGIVNAHGAHPMVTVLPDGVRTLAELALSQGLETGAFVSGGNLTSRMGMNRGFQTWDEELTDVSARVDALLRWIFDPDRGRFVALLHTYQVHAPYLPPAALVPEFTDPEYAGPLRSRTEKYLAMPVKDAWEAAVGPAYWEGMLDYTEADVRFLSDLYDAEIRHVDEELGRLLKYIDGSDLREKLAIVLLADHGEEFRDHGKYQHDQVFEELMHVPLMVRFPPAWRAKGMTGRVELPVGLVDVAPSIADMLGLPWQDLGWAGQSLAPLLARPGEIPPGLARRPTFGELVIDPGPKYYRSVVWQGWKYIHVWQKNINHTWEYLFDLGTDPAELRNRLGDTAPEAVRALGALKQLLARYTARNEAKASRLGAPGQVEMDPEMLENMRRLGYVDLDSDTTTTDESGN